MPVTIEFSGRRRVRWLAWSVVILAMSGSASAQGLVWSLPDEVGAGVRYEGTYRQLVKRPNVVEGDSTIEWRRRLRIAYVGQQDAEFRGASQPCHWIEFKVQTGRPKEGDIDSGPGSTRIYKVLIPDSVIRGQISEPIAADREIYISYIPIVKGYRKVGDEPAQAIEPPVFQIRPVLSQLQHYRNLHEDGPPTEIQTMAGNLSAQLSKGTSVFESLTRRTTSTGETFRSEGLPFGVAKWKVKVVMEEKPTTAPRTDFIVTNEITEEMVAQEVLSGAESELITPDE